MVIGHSIISHQSIFFQLPVKTVIVTPPVDLYLEVDDPYAVFRCEAYSDASTPVTITWELDGKPLEFYAVSPRFKIGYFIKLKLHSPMKISNL